MDRSAPGPDVQVLADRGAAVAGVDPAVVASMPEAQLASEIAAIHETQDLLEAALAARLVAFDAQQGYVADGAASAAQWAGRVCGADPRAEAGRVRVAQKLARTSAVADAVVSGKLSYPKARVLVRYLTPHPPGTAEQRRVEDAFGDCEAELVELARDLTVRQCERLMQRWYLQLEPEDAERRWNEQWTKRHLHLSPALEGTAILSGVLDAESHATFRQALDHAYERLWRADVEAAKAAGSPQLRRTPAQRWVDALVEVAHGYLAFCNLPDERGHHRPALPSIHAVIELDPHTGAIEAGTIAEIPAPTVALQRLTCEGRLARLLTTPDSVPLDLGRSTDLATPHQRRALTHRDGGCAFPGCDRPPRWCNAHHCTHRQHQGPTNLDNLTLLCRYHHRLMHEGGWHCWIDHTDHRPRFQAPDGHTLAPDPPDPRPPRPPTAGARSGPGGNNCPTSRG